MSQLKVWSDEKKFLTSSELDQIQKMNHIIPEEMEREGYLGSYSSFVGSPLQLGQFQDVILVELDGPRERNVVISIQ